MHNHLNLDQIEKKAFTSHLQAGQWEIFIGGLFLAMGFYSLATASVWNDLLHGLMIGGAIMAMTLIRKNIVAPRVGTAVYGPDRQKRLKMVAISIALMVLVGLGVFLMRSQTDEALTWIPGLPSWLIPALLILVLFLTIGRLSDHPQFYLVGMICAAGFGIKSATGNAWFLAAAGVLVLLLGLSLLFRFLRNHPLTDETMDREVK